MASDANVRVIALSLVIIALFVTSFLYYQVNETNISLIMVFAGIFFSLILASGVVRHDKKK